MISTTTTSLRNAAGPWFASRVPVASAATTKTPWTSRTTAGELLAAQATTVDPTTIANAMVTVSNIIALATANPTKCVSSAAAVSTASA